MEYAIRGAGVEDCEDIAQMIAVSEARAGASRGMATSLSELSRGLCVLSMCSQEMAEYLEVADQLTITRRGTV